MNELERQDLYTMDKQSERAAGRDKKILPAQQSWKAIVPSYEAAHRLVKPRPLIVT